MEIWRISRKPTKTACTAIYFDHINAVELNIDVLHTQHKHNAWQTVRVQYTLGYTLAHTKNGPFAQMSVTPDTAKRSEGQRRGRLGGQITRAASLCLAKVPHTLELDRLLLWKARGALRHEGGRRKMRGKEKGEKSWALTIILLQNDSLETTILYQVWYILRVFAMSEGRMLTTAPFVIL